MHAVTDNQLKPKAQVSLHEKANEQARDFSDDELQKVAGGLTDAEAIDLQLRQLQEQALKEQAQTIKNMTEQHGDGGVIRNI